ncbi:CNNM domain-containing protein [Halosimplex halobium]|uniref:CNNM domain-containing protein n=1 Tax=Halosimplex halobium TaxID=3396618 RepID=UPI003F5721C0
MVTLSLLVPSVAAVVGLVALSAFFSSSESAIFSLPEEWVREAAADGSPDGAALGELRADPHRLLVTILVGNNVVNMAISSIVTLLVADVFSPGLAVVLATVGASTLILVFGEIVPKSYGLGHARTWSRRVARPLTLVEVALGPVVSLFDASTRRLTALVGGDQGIEENLLDE